MYHSIITYLPSGPLVPTSLGWHGPEGLALQHAEHVYDPSSCTWEPINRETD